MTLRVALRNETPDGEQSYVAGANPAASGVAEGVYLGILTVNIPGAASGAYVEGVEQLAVAGPDGPTRVVGFTVGR